MHDSNWNLGAQVIAVRLVRLGAVEMLPGTASSIVLPYKLDSTAYASRANCSLCVQLWAFRRLLHHSAAQAHGPSGSSPPPMPDPSPLLQACPTYQGPTLSTVLWLVDSRSPPQPHGLSPEGAICSSVCSAGAPAYKASKHCAGRADDHGRWTGRADGHGDAQ